MGLLSIFSRAEASVQMLPSGTVTFDRNANILASTVSSAFSQEQLCEIGTLIIGVFKSAAVAQVPLGELKLSYASILITARELRGGAVLFLSPTDPFNLSPLQDKM